MTMGVQSMRGFTIMCHHTSLSLVTATSWMLVVCSLVSYASWGVWRERFSRGEIGSAAEI